VIHVIDVEYALKINLRYFSEYLKLWLLIANSLFLPRKLLLQLSEVGSSEKLRNLNLKFTEKLLAEALLLCHRTFISPNTFLNKIISRSDVPIPPCVDSGKFQQEVIFPIHIRFDFLKEFEGNVKFPEYYCLFGYG
jgi:hypothetical protein